MQDGLNRRDLLRSAALLGLLGGNAKLRAAAGTASMIGVPFTPTQTVRFGVIGTGGRGTSMIEEMIALENAEIRAVCDVNRDAALTAVGKIEKAGKKAPEAYTKGDHDFENLAGRDDLDFIYVATPWDWHVPMALAALKAQKHVGVEVPAATTLDDCWTLVNASEKARRHCLIMENCCYGENELLVLNLVKAGLLGDLVHGEAAYIHDLREELLSSHGEGLWRRFPHTRQNGNLYPTHGLGPVANYMGINRGDRFDYLVSVSSLQAGLEQYRDAHFPPDDPKRKEKYVEGDMNTSVIRTALGRTIVLQHDVVNARPYDRINLISGTKGIFRDYPPRIYLDGQAGGEAFTSIDSFKAKYEHPLWQTSGDLARKLGGHGGMDFLMLYRLVECFRQGIPPDIDVYDAAAWSAPAPLSQASVANGSAPAKFPDFTRGRWSEKRGWLA
jgi:predicted dehydrogenase